LNVSDIKLVGEVGEWLGWFVAHVCLSLVGYMSYIFRRLSPVLLEVGFMNCGNGFLCVHSELVRLLCGSVE